MLTQGWTRQHVVVQIGLAVTLVLQIAFGSLVLAALGGVLVIFVFRGERRRASDEVAHGGVTMGIGSSRHPAVLRRDHRSPRAVRPAAGRMGWAGQG